MRPLTMVFAILLLAVVETAAAARGSFEGFFFELGSRRSAGHIFNEESVVPRYAVILDVGIQQFSDGKRDTARDQQWFLRCESHQPDGTSRTSCHLTRTALDNWGLDGGLALGTVCSQTEHSIYDGTLEILDADWGAGQIDLNIVHGDKSKTHILLDLAYEGSFISLKGLKAAGSGRGPSGAAVTLEYRLPEYTYVQHVPIVMNGAKSAFEKEWDMMVGTLEPADRAVCRRLFKERDQIYRRVMESFQNDGDVATIREAAERDAEEVSSLTRGEKLLEDLAQSKFLLEIKGWLDASEITVTGKARVIKLLSGD